jgi:hypothetical protein
METLSPEQLAEIHAGRATHERKLAICSGALSLPSVDRVELLCILAADPDERIATRSQEALLSQPLEAFLEALAREDAAPALFSWCGHHYADKPGVADAMVKNRACGPEHLVPVVLHLSTDCAQALMEELDRVSSSPVLAAALEHSTSITADQKQMLHELRGTTLDSATLEEIVAAETEPHKRQTLIQELSKMTVSQRVQLALKGGSEERRALIRDVCKVVQRAVLQSPRLTDREVESFAAQSNLTDEILRSIASNRNFRRNYAVVRNLMNNPKTPVDVSLHMLPNLNPQDLKLLLTNKNIPETLRSTAQKLFRQRQAARQGAESS